MNRLTESVSRFGKTPGRQVRTRGRQGPDVSPITLGNFGNHGAILPVPKLAPPFVIAAGDSIRPLSTASAFLAAGVGGPGTNGEKTSRRVGEMAVEQDDRSKRAQRVRERQQRYLVPGVGTNYRDALVLDRGEGRRVTDVEGRSYLDFFGGILTVSVGHAHPAVTARVEQQLKRLVHTSTLYITEPMVDLAEKLASITPEGLEQSFFTTSGTEANETAIQMAQRATGNREIIALRHSYSGRSQLAQSLTGQGPWRQQVSEFPIRLAHTAYCYRCPWQKTPTTCGLECARDMQDLIDTATSGRVAALIAEPIQGVGGFITPPPAFFDETAAIVRRAGGLFISDEVQTGFGRTGKPFGISHSSVRPDLMTFAKGLANGFPIGATIATQDVARHYTGPTISTFGGNPVSMAAALATLEVMGSEQLTERAAELGRYLRAGLEALSDRYPAIGDVRGRGLMQGLELVRREKAPAPDLALAFLEAARERGLLVGKGGLHANVIRIAPPLTVTRSEIDEALRMLEEVMRALHDAEPTLREVSPTRVAVP
jgi:4-aminobutyrate aminotransferase-like enzyme